ncbi:DEAD/DEAH box helicase family protein [Theileria parva strain Muguga]|uniref:DEAD/DEAH box helicase family protein n=1 Tax=Theileria parva strain Muguga TaxID=333668 RepID=UPI001C621128|nr:DEAD/DEAH box helicase family protein [Theileria parva strain Muguga]EAN33618.2 DEAD/DEAH box helicase family protein [Theileria parva strain Muguga]
MTTASEDLKLNPLWVYRFSNYTNESSGVSADELLKTWNIHPHLRNVIKEKRIKRFFPVQEKSIPLLLNNTYRDKYSVLSCDFIITAPTGQGKTLSYALPLLNNILNLKENKLLTLIIVPSRELVKQIYEVFSWFIDSSNSTYDLKGSLLKARVFYGDRSFVKSHDLLVHDPPHIAISTPGVLVEYSVDFQKNEFYKTFEHLKWIVVDEVDTMLNQSFYEWVDVVVDLVNKLKSKEPNQSLALPQKILVSATVPLKSHDIELLELNRPILLRLKESIYKLPENLRQSYVVCSNRPVPLEFLKLMAYLYQEVTGNVLVFFSKVEICHKISRLMQIYNLKHGGGFKATELTGRMSQKQRNNAIKTYKEEDRVCLLCSDVASRGMDLSNTKVVVSYDFPNKLSSYIHRAGRTARGNKRGTFCVFVSNKTEKKFHNFMNKLKINEEKLQKIELDVVLSKKKVEEISESYKLILEMTEKALELEASGNLEYGSDLSGSLELLKPVPEREE